MAMQGDGSRYKFRSLTMSSDATTTQHSEKLLALHLLEDCGPGHFPFLCSDMPLLPPSSTLTLILLFTNSQGVFRITSRKDWKKGGKLLGPNVRAYDPKPPASSELDISKYPLKLASMTKAAGKRGWSSYVIQLSNEVRARWASDPVFAGEWRSLVGEFDKKFSGSIAERVDVPSKVLCWWGPPRRGELPSCGGCRRGCRGGRHCLGLGKRAPDASKHARRIHR